MRDDLAGWLNGFTGMLIFSGSLPATRVAVAAFDPLFLTAARASIAGLVALAWLSLAGVARPPRRDWLSLAIVAAGVVVGFPLCTALALQHITAAQSIVFIAILPLATALFGVWRGGERPRPVFWLFSALGSLLVIAHALAGATGVASLVGSAWMLLAVVTCGFGYAEGGRVARTLGGWQTISWALVLSLPAMLVCAMAWHPERVDGVGWSGWTALAYVSLFSMLIGFVFWYRGLALGGIAAVGQLQLLQPFFGLLLAALLLGESVSGMMVITAMLVAGCVAAARRAGQLRESQAVKG